ncbi:MAG: hypothetical protein KGK01_08230 [Bradyrhizobium sp.]|nr:hypothetical protein [Bradyrhizobium sp.]
MPAEINTLAARDTDLIKFDAAGKMTEFEPMIRPAWQALDEEMGTGSARG